MSDERDALDRLLDQATEALRRSGTPGPSAALAARTVERLPAAETVHLPPSLPAVRRRLRPWLAWAVAASVLVAVAGWWSGSATSRAFAQVVDAIQRAAAVKLEVTARIGSQPPQQSVVSLWGSKLRMTWFDGALVAVGDLASGRLLLWDSTQEQFQESRLQQHRLGMFLDPVEGLRQLKGRDAQSLGLDRLGDQTLQLYRVRSSRLLWGAGGGDALVWVDPQTNLPQRIVIRDADPKHESEIVMDSFQWQATGDPAEFALAPPDGYRPGTIMLTPGEGAPPERAPAAAAEGARLIAGDRVPRALAWSGDSQRLAAIVTDPEDQPVQHARPSELRQWSLDDEQLRWSIPLGGGAALAAEAGGAIIATCEGREIQIREAASGAILRTMVAGLPLPALAMSGDGKLLAAGLADWQAHRTGAGGASGVELWDVDRGTLVRKIAEQAPVTFAALSPDGQWIASGTAAGGVKLWRASDGQLVQSFVGQPEAAFSADSRRLAVAVTRTVGNAVTVGVEVYDVETLALQHSLATDEQARTILGLAFSPDGQSLAAGSWEGRLYRWRLDAGVQPERVDVVGGGIHAVAYSPDGAWLATGSEDGALLAWPAAADGTAN